jgi:acetate kinase
VLLYLQRAAGLDAAEMENVLATQSGLLGMAGSADMRVLLADESPDAALAVAVYCHRVRKVIGAYAAVLGGLDGIVFGGGVGEHAAEIRSRVLAGMDWLGLRIDAAANGASAGPACRISAAGSPCEAWVVAVDEAGELAHAGQRALTGMG